MPNITVFTYAMLSKDVYYSRITSPRLKARGWKHLENMDNKVSFSSPFFARLYYHERHLNEYVIAYRGTVLDPREYGNEAVEGNVETDAEIFADTKLPNKLKFSPPIFDQAMKFYRNAKKAASIAANITSPRIKLTGHSLGGALASYVAAKTKAIAVVFNAPGIKQLPDVPQGDYPNIHNFNAKDGTINKVGDKYGDEHIVKIPNNETECQESGWHLIDQKNCLSGQHAIVNMVASLQKDLAVAGERF